MSVLSDMAVDFVGDVGKSLIGNAITQKDYRKNTGMNFMYSQRAQREAPSNLVRGLKMAGLSPALATDGAFSPASGNAAPLGTMPLAPTDIATIRLTNAEARKSQAQAESLELENANKRNANLTAETFIKGFIGDWLASPSLSENTRFYLEKLQRDSENVGALSVVKDMIDSVDKKVLYDADKMESMVRQAVSARQLGTIGESYDIVKDMAELPSKQWAQLHALALQALQQAENLKSGTALTEENIKLSKAQQAQLREVTAQMRDQNIKQFVDKGEYGNALLALLVSLVRSIGFSVHN